MWFVILGVLLLVLKLVGYGPPAEWNFDVTGDLWKFLLPFGLAVAWWAYADASGLSKRRAMDKLDARKAARRKRDLEALGIGERDKRK